MTLNGPYACTLLQNLCVFGAQHQNLKEDRPILSAAKLSPNASSFWQCKVYADIRGVSLERGRQKTVGLSKTGYFLYFRSLLLQKLYIITE